MPMNQRTFHLHLDGEEGDAGVRGNLYALTIGINEYKSQQYRNLSGCLADVHGINEYLQAVLSVNPRNIISLRDHEATRAAILKELKSFIANPKIQPGDPIFIYFAGHGAEAKSPQGWTSNNSKTQMLIPHDCGTQIGGEVVHGIPDRTLGWILREMADVKGNNITVILDNCFSGSGTRAAQSAYQLRGVDYRLQLPRELDAEHAYKHKLEPIYTTRALNIVPGFLHGGFKSHVLISACGAEERAREFSGHGVFTEALLNALKRWRSHGIPLESLTYKHLLDLIGNLDGQNPQCEGDHQDRYVFNAKVPHRPRISYTGSVKSNILHLDAGTAHGITVGSKMLIWKDLESYYLLEDNPTAEVSLYNVNLYNSTARAPQILLHGSSVVAQHVLSGDRPELRIHVRDEASSRMVHDAVTREPVDNVIKPMNIVPSPIETASVVISTAREGIYFDFLDPEINRHGLKRLPHTTRANVIDLQRTIHAISHHLYHLRFPKIPVDEEAAFFASKVSIEVFKAKVYLDDPPSIVGDNLNVNGKGIDLEMDGSPQVIVIKNDSEFDIYPALFYFECIDLSITPIYLPPTAGHNKVDPPLRANQSLPIGCGTGSGGVPHVFENDGPGCIELGFLKLFIMSRAVDLCHLAQESPFRHVEAVRPSVLAQESALKNTRGMRPYVPTKTFDFFQTLVVPVVVRNTPRRSQANTAVQPASNPTTMSRPSDFNQPRRFKSMWNKTLRTSSPIDTQKINVKVKIRSQTIPHPSPPRQTTSSLAPAFLARLKTSMRYLEGIDQDLKAIETAQREGIEELKEIGQRVENIRLELTRQDAS